MAPQHFLPHFVSLNNSSLLKNAPANITTETTANHPDSSADSSGDIEWLVLALIIVSGIFGLIYLFMKCFSSRIEREEGYDMAIASRTSRKNRGFGNPSANRCFANALLVCLYNLPGFREQIKRANRIGGFNSILKKVEELVEALDKSYLDQEIEKKKEEFFEEVMKKNPENKIFKDNGGDSRFLFQVLCENLYPKEYSYNNGYFSFKQEKFVSCEKCLGTEREKAISYTENATMLNIQEDYYFQKKSPSNYFQPEKEKRMCKACNEHTNHVKHFSLLSFPKILAIRIGDNLDYEPSGNTSPHLSLKIGPKGQERHLKFLARVYNTNRGYRGVHSVAYVKSSEGSFRCFDDLSVFSVGKKRIRGYPKLLFYVEEDSSRQVDSDLLNSSLELHV